MYSLYSWGVRITPGGVDELPLSLFTVVIGVPKKNDEKIGPLSAMKPEKLEITVLEICEKEHIFQRALDNSREPEDVVDPWKNRRKMSYRQKTKVLKFVEDKKIGKTHICMFHMEGHGI